MRTTQAKPFERFGTMIREARTARKWAQRDLARRLKVGQQAISNWERGTSRPENEAGVHAIAKIFTEIDRETWLQAASHSTKEKKPTPQTPALPVSPLLETLPFGGLSFEQFQSFCALMIELLYPGATINQFGIQGDKQDGIDIEARLRDRQYFTFQCKREKEFGPADLNAAIKKHKVPCDRAFILLSRPASALTRKAIKGKRKWELWDSYDIARKIRSLPTVAAKRLIDTYFRSHRKPFLGLDEPGAFETREEYFAPLLHRDRVFSHAWTLVGRDDELKAVLSLVERPRHEPTMLMGSGGIGKSRLVRAVADAYASRHPDNDVLILPASKRPSADEFDQFGAIPTLLIIEDAHEQPDLNFVLSCAARAKADIRILLTSRPHGRQLILSEASKNGFDLTDKGIVAIKGLDIDRAEDIAREILRDRNGPLHVAAAIARLTHESPLALVVGSYLVASERINPNVLNNSDRFRNELFGHFRDAITGELGVSVKQDLIKQTLELIALVQPIDPERPKSQTLASEVLGEPFDRIKRSIQLLYEAGVLVRRGREFRIIPDLLADYLLEDSCITKATSASSGYVERVLQSADAESLANMLVNVAKLDWRLSEHDKLSVQIADSVWQRAELLCQSQSEGSRAIVKGVVSAAFYQPEHALHVYDTVRQLDQDSVELCSLLKHVAMNFDHIDAACVRLWELGKKDARQLNQHPNHPVRVLKELAAVEREKPVQYCERVVDFAIGLLNTTHEATDAYSPLEILESALATEGHSSEWRGDGVRMSGFGVRREAVAGVRRKIIDFLLKSVRSKDLPTAVRAAACLGEALRGPMGLVGRQVGSEERDSWTPEFVETLGRIKILVECAPLDPLVLIRLWQAVKWHADHSTEPTKPHAQAVIDAMPTSTSFRLTLAIADGWGHLQQRSGDFQLTREAWHDEQKKIADDFVTAAGKSQTAIDTLGERIAAMQSARVLSNAAPGIFVRILSERFPEVARLLSEQVLKQPSDSLRVVFAEALCGLAAKDPDGALTIAKAAVALGSVELTRAVAWAYSVLVSSPTGVRDDEVELLAGLLESKDEWTVTSSLQGIASRAESDPAGILKTLLNINIGRSRRIADEFFSVLQNSKAFPIESFDREQVKELLSKLASCSTIEDYWVATFLAKVSKSFPAEVLHFLIDRIEAPSEGEIHEFQPIPYLFHEDSKFRFRESNAYATSLRSVREWMLDAPTDAMTIWWGPQLYAAVAGVYDAAAVADLEAWAFSDDVKKVKMVGRVLHEAPSSFLFESVSFVAALIDHAAILGKDCHDSVTSNLWSAVMSGMRHGTPGKPFPEDLELRDRAREVLAKLPRGSASWGFFSELLKSAEDKVRERPGVFEEEFGY